GALVLFAGQGAGFSGDGRPATQAHLFPFDVIVDHADNVLDADFSNGRVRQIDVQGIISTFAGNGRYRFNPQATPAPQLFLSSPGRIAFSPSGQPYIPDAKRILRVEADGRVFTVLGDGDIQPYASLGPLPASAVFLAGPDGIAFDSKGNLYVSDTGQVL